MSGQASSSSSKPQATPQQILQLYTQYLPSILGITTDQIPKVTDTLAKATTAANPIYTQSGLSQLQDYGAGYQNAGNQLTANQAASANALLQNAGGASARSADSLNRELNKELYGTQSRLAGGVDNLLKMYGNGSTMSPGETAAAERSINQSNTATGNLGNSNAMNTVANALNFGQYARDKQNNYANALGVANSALGTIGNNKFDAANFALNSGNTAGNFGLNLFNPTQATGTGTTATEFGSGLFSGLAGVGSASKSSGHSAGGGINCCFILMEGINGPLPWYVRQWRDYYYLKNPEIARGYRKMASWLVPAMRHSSIIKWIVNAVMVKPIINHGSDLTFGTQHTGSKLVKNFWFKVWTIMGK